MAHPVVSALVPVVLFISAGILAARRGWIGAGAVKDLSNLVFMLLTPALLFRTMSTVHLEQLDFEPVLAYLLGAAVVFALVLGVRGFSRHSAIVALAGTFSNTVMIGVPLVGLALGEAGLVTLFTLISVHALVLLTAATVVLELAVAREAGHGSGARHMLVTVLAAVRNGVLHPVPLPIIAGLLFAQTGLTLPAEIDQSLQLLGAALGPMSLLLVGATLAYSGLGHQLRGAIGIALVKNLLHPVLVLGLGKLLGLGGVPLAAMVLTASLPVGANVFLFSQRYRTAEEVVTASVAVSTVLGLVTLPLVLIAIGWL
ncbi:AEC family transporter [Xylophilus sp. GW821-FHT01B05]